MDEDEFRLKIVQLQTKQVVLTEETNRKLDTLVECVATSEDVAREGKLTRERQSKELEKALQASREDHQRIEDGSGNGNSEFYQRLILVLLAAVLALSGLEALVSAMLG